MSRVTAQKKNLPLCSSSAKDRRVGYLALMHGEHAETRPENPQQKIK